MNVQTYLSQRLIPGAQRRLLPGLLTAVLTGFTIAGCSNESSSVQTPEAADSGLQIPRAILEARAVEWQSVYPRVTLGDGTEIVMVKDDEIDGRWNGQTILLPANSNQTVTVNWYEPYQGAELLLVRQIRRDVIVDSNVNTYLIQPGIEIFESADSSEFDADQDGIANLIERRENTDPLDRQSGINVIIPRIDPANAPAIDGGFINYEANDLVLAGEWSIAVQTDRAGKQLAIANILEDTGSAAQTAFYHHWAAAHDGTFLYILVVSDDNGEHVSDSPNDIFQDDEIELYFDGDNSKLTTYDGVNDFQIHISLLERVLSSANSSSSFFQRIEAGVNSQALPQELDFAVGLRRGPRSPRAGVDRQDIYEVKINMAELGITPGQPFGFEVQINDDDDGDVRETKWAWHHPPNEGDNTWFNPSFMGTAILGE